VHLNHSTSHMNYLLYKKQESDEEEGYDSNYFLIQTKFNELVGKVKSINKIYFRINDNLLAAKAKIFPN